MSGPLTKGFIACSVFAGVVLLASAQLETRATMQSPAYIVTTPAPRTVRGGRANHRVGKAVEIKSPGQPPVKVKSSGQECPLYGAGLERSEKPAWERYRVTRFGTKPTRFVAGDVL
jgi:hypothetical protein